jgi:hypothetical protein
MGKVVKVGLKQRHVTIPDGWEIVTHGEAMPGDYFANVNSGKFEPCNEKDGDFGMSFETFELLIRSTSRTQGIRPILFPEN